MTHSRKLIPVAVLLLVLLSACSVSLAEDITPPPGSEQTAAPPPLPTNPPVQVELNPAPALPDPLVGEVIYRQSCSPCHGEQGLGDGFQAENLPNPASPVGDPALAIPSIPMEWYAIVSEGRMDRFMPPFAGSLSDQQRWDVLAYTYQLSTSGVELELGAQLYENTCAACHGQTGQGDGSEAASLNSSLPDFSTPEFFAVQSIEVLYESITDGLGTEMPAYATVLSDDERLALAQYVRSLAHAEPDGESTEASPDESAEEGSPSAEESEKTASEGSAAGEDTATRIGKVTGVLLNGSGGEVPIGSQVTLHGFDHIQEVFTTTVSVEDDGSYIFEDVDMPDSRVFIVTVDYSEATYNSDLGIIEPGTSALNLPVTVFDTSDDASMLVVDRLHIFVETLENQSLHIVELYLISNPTDKVIVAPEEDEPVVHYKLPPGATGLQFQSGAPNDRYIITAEGFGDTMAIPPGSGQYQVMYAYDLAYDSKVDINHDLTLPVNSVVLLVPDVGLRVNGDNFQDDGLRDFQGEDFQIYSRDRMAAGSELEFTVSGSLGGSSTLLGGGEEQNRLALGGLILALALTVIGIWAIRRFYWIPRHEPELVQLVPVPAPVLDDAEFDSVDSVLDAIIALDDMHTAGELSDEAYSNRRVELFAILKRKKESSGGTAEK